MTIALQRITTEYIPEEDRLRLSAQGGAGEPVVIWLTQRVLRLMLPSLLGWLERQGGAVVSQTAVHSFVQQAARAQMQPVAPVARAAVETALATGATWLVQAVDLIMADTAVQLVFRGAAGDSASLTLAPTPLRQWLSILHEHDRKAEWLLPVWPVWLSEAGQALADGPLVLH